MVDLAETFTKAIHGAVPGSQVSFDTDSLSAPCSSYPSPSYHYDVARLSDVVDFLVVMDCALRHACLYCTACRVSPLADLATATRCTRR